jgi:hypothetical protein
MDGWRERGKEGREEKVERKGRKGKGKERNLKAGLYCKAHLKHNFMKCSATLFI